MDVPKQILATYRSLHRDSYNRALLPAAGAASGTVACDAEC